MPCACGHAQGISTTQQQQTTTHTSAVSGFYSNPENPT